MKLPALAVLAAVLVGPAAVAADDPRWTLRVRGVQVHPHDDSGTIVTVTDTGTGMAVDSATGAEVDLAYGLSRRFGLELALARPGHDLSLVGGSAGGLDAGSVSVLSAALVLQYVFESDGPFRPYAGAGILHARFDHDLSPDLASNGITELRFDSSLGLALNAGVDWRVGERWVVNADLKVAGISTDVDLVSDGERIGGVGVDVDPVIAGVGVGVRF